ncbi:hypothetical protein SEA_INKED_91 [Arthrobacter phage Inked]|nr:hypothetical protein SEA_INKED_91 [Arthrobacter phage Inked]
MCFVPKKWASGQTQILGQCPRIENIPYNDRNRMSLATGARSIRYPFIF